ncbi:hypothetical protein PYW07_008272 [Mythimna separata]|uniref:Peptidase S1 domain-containing protein n=1 Tax=Mythimna separata TaxID=271217 RepID=A0AAD8DMP6_MYTSE|nr:hypothetical protein PYW07_008272 [Mythimna separata]
MFKKPGLLVLVLTILQVSAQYKSVESDSIDNVINTESVESRIVSGWEAKPGQHPHHAAVHFINTNTGMVRMCGGSIISKQWIVSIARCAVNWELAIVRLGVVSIRDNNLEHIFLSTDVYIHPEWNQFSIEPFQPHDVALIKLQRPLVYTSLIKRIRVQSSADKDRDYDGEQVYASGHGRTASTGFTSNVLRWVYLRAISNTECRNLTSGVFNTTICARYYNVTSQSICNNDHGGPLVHVESDGVPTLIGIAYFFPEGTCESGRPSGFLRPGAFLSWFKEVTGIDFENLQEEYEIDTTVADTTVTNTTVADNTTMTVPTNITTPTTTTTPITTTIVSASTDSEDQDLEEFTPEDNTTPKDTEESEEEENPESPQLSKHRTVNVNVKVLTNIKQK